MRIAIGLLVCGVMLGVSAQAADEPQPGKFSKLWIFHKSGKKAAAEESAKPEPAPKPGNHVEPFPNISKAGVENQPQNEKEWWGDRTWRTTRNKDSWSNRDSK